ncbi:MAG: IS110 family transposase [Planctomycetota bacterium]
MVANPRQLALISQHDRKSDRTDAEWLARLARVDPQLLAPVTPRDAQTQADRTLISSRDTLVRMRTLLVNHVRGTAKAFGLRLSKCSAGSLGKRVAAEIPPALQPSLSPILEQITMLTSRIREYDRQIEAVSEERYPATRHLRQIRGVGPISALAFVLAIGDPRRFTKSRKVGSYVGLAPRRDQSGDTDKQLRITKAEDPLLRKLLLQCAHYQLGPFGEDSDLRRWAHKKSEHGGASARKRALVAVARKLAVRMHRIWITGEIYDPLRLAKARGELTP